MDKIEELLSRGVEEVIDKAHLEAALKGKKKLRVKLGIDPTSPSIHIGRAVVLWKLRAFQDLGHKIVLIVGDFTGLVGDTSDKDSERPMLSEAEIKKNLKTYFQQAFKILDPKKTETHYNSKWLKKLNLLEVGKMMDLFGLHEMAARENVSKRMKEGKRVSFREMLYPILQGYDSVAVKADVELGGTDQRFNLLAGRSIQPMYKQQSQDILMTSLMEGTDGRKMSSSWGNVINITDEPNDMFGKVMRVDDPFIEKYFVLATQVPLDEIKEIMKLPNPRDQKLILAEKLTALYHNDKIAAAAKENFLNQYSKNQQPDNIETGQTFARFVQASGTLTKYLGVTSKSEARRLIDQGAVKVDGEVIKKDVEIEFTDVPKLVQIGKRRQKKLIGPT